MARMKITGALLMSCLFLLSSSAFAADQAATEGFESYSLGEVYIKGEKPPVTQEASVTNVITAEDIKATSSRTVAEALSHTPGIRVSTGRKNEPNVSIRGLDQSRVLILIDGVPYYETKGGKLDLNQIPADNIAKIEVTKGAASVLYGANALGGVVNIITKKASGKPFFEVTGETGDVDYYGLSASHGMKIGKFNYWLNYSHRQAHGTRMSDDFVPMVGQIYRGGTILSTGVFEDGGTRNNSDYKSDSFWAKLGFEPSANSEYFVNFYYIDREKGAPAAIDRNQANTARIVGGVVTSAAFTQFARIPVYDDWGIDLSGQQKISDKMTLKGKLFYHDHVDDYVSYKDNSFSEIYSISRYKDYMVGGALISEVKPASWDTLRLSINYRGDSHKERADSYIPFSNFFSYTGSVGMENEFNPTKSFSVVVGGSYDWFHVTQATKSLDGTSVLNLVDLDKPKTMDSFNPMIGATYAFADTTKLFASVARKTRFPTLGNLFSSTPSSGSNVNLKAENAINSTVGVSRSFGKLMWSELAFFYNNISDLISRDGSGLDSTYRNIASVEMYGIEVNTELYPLKDLVVRLGYTYNHASDQSDVKPVVDGKTIDQVTNVPEHKLDMGVQYTVPYLKTCLDLNGILYSNSFSQLPTVNRPTQDTINLPGYFVLNARVSQKFLKYFEAFLSVNNIFDRDYTQESGSTASGAVSRTITEPGFPAPGRNIFGGITAKF
ncbi:MAG: TonB-dependent receptor [Geobacter sp.]|nr:MAG: TonB-dependent receptor [Geobacter sp.]